MRAGKSDSRNQDSIVRKSENDHVSGREPVQLGNKRLIIGLVLFILVAFGITGLLVYKNYQLKKEVEKEKAKLLVTRTEATQRSYASHPNEIEPTQRTNSVKNWITYTNKKYGFKVKYDPQSSPTEQVKSRTTGQPTPLLSINFGTNPLKFPHGYILTVSRQKSINDYRSELIGHDANKIDSEKEVVINGNAWTKLNYQLFITTHYVPVTTAILNRSDYSYSIVAPTLDVDQILSTFEFID